MPIAANDNSDPRAWPVPPIVGVVRDDGRVVWSAAAGPNDPHEA